MDISKVEMHVPMDTFLKIYLKGEMPPHCFNSHFPDYL